jgi:hypothetical protein
MGEIVGLDAAGKANSIFEQVKPSIDSVISNIKNINIQRIGQVVKVKIYFSQTMDLNVRPKLNFVGINKPLLNSLTFIGQSWLSNQIFEITYQISSFPETMRTILAQVDSAVSTSGTLQKPYVALNPFIIDKEKPFVQSVLPSSTLINDSIANISTFFIDVVYNEICNTNSLPTLSFSNASIIANILSLNSSQSTWISLDTYRFVYSVTDTDEEILNIDFQIYGGLDQVQNLQDSSISLGLFQINTTNPALVSYTISDSILTQTDIGNNKLSIVLQFNQALEQAELPSLIFADPNILNSRLTLNAPNSFWIDSFTLQMNFNLLGNPYQSDWLDLDLSQIKDRNGNAITQVIINDALIIDTKKPAVLAAIPSATIISDNELGVLNFKIQIYFDEKMNLQQKPIAELFFNNALNTELNYNVFGSEWLSDSIFEARFNLQDNNVELDSFELRINFAQDEFLNAQGFWNQLDWIDLDTQNPEISSLTANTYNLTSQNTQWELTAVFDEAMDTSIGMELTFLNAPDINGFLSINNTTSLWLSDSIFKLVYDLLPGTFMQENITASVGFARDIAKNEVEEFVIDSFFSLNLETVGIKDVTSLISVYPSPVAAGSILNFMIDKSNLNVQLNLYNGLGQVAVSENVLLNSSGEGFIDIPYHLEGIYFIVLTSESASVQGKIMVIK